MAHAEAVLRPEGLTVDTFDGTAYLSIVPHTMLAGASALTQPCVTLTRQRSEQNMRAAAYDPRDAG